ncbi:MAG: nitroreductase [Chitinophagales bacterium]
MNPFETIKSNIENRRTIKPEVMNGKTISDKDFMEVLELANWAPTHGFTEPWRFVVFKEDALARFSSYHALLYKEETPKDKYQQRIFDKILSRTEKVSHLLAIVMKKGNNIKIPEIEELAATSIAVQNIWLGATAKQIACYWGSGGMTYHPKMSEYLGFGEEDRVMGCLYMGYTDQPWPNGKRLTSIEEKITIKD